MNPSEYVRQTIDLVSQIETRFLELGKRLYTIRTKELWREMHESYTDFLEEARISPSMASMLYSIHRNYIVDGHQKMESLTGIGYSNLYEAIPLIERDGVATAIVKAETLSRSEIKDEVREEKHGNHRHKVGIERWGTCETCGKFIRIDESKAANKS
jgi:hypothetical protein